MVGTMTLLLGWILDLIFGDPERLPHPVVYMGKWISFWEHRLNKGSHRLAKGAVFAVCSVIMVFVLSQFLLYTLMFMLNAWLASPWDRVSCEAVMAVFVFFCLAGHTLRKEVRMVFEAVDRGLDEGRRQVARIVGRDTNELSAQEVRTAALETLAENLSDGVVAPVFWFAILGLPGMLAYKMVNTLDSMIGYQNPRYKDFGCWAARIDDVANYIPARITALFMLVAASLLSIFTSVRSRFIERLKFTLHYGPQHASPNSGWPEAALASILDCQFGGSHNYFGEIFYKPHIGNNPRKLTTSDMRMSIRICFVAEIIAIALVLMTSAML